jgi:uncharacterized membrane protein YgaE (UPF0421/DUF939 family)
MMWKLSLLMEAGLSCMRAREMMRKRIKKVLEVIPILTKMMQRKESHNHMRMNLTLVEKSQTERAQAFIHLSNQNLVTREQLLRKWNVKKRLYKRKK